MWGARSVQQAGMLRRVVQMQQQQQQQAFASQGGGRNSSILNSCKCSSSNYSELHLRCPYYGRSSNSSSSLPRRRHNRSMDRSDNGNHNSAVCRILSSTAAVTTNSCACNKYTRNMSSVPPTDTTSSGRSCSSSSSNSGSSTSSNNAGIFTSSNRVNVTSSPGRSTASSSKRLLPLSSRSRCTSTRRTITLPASGSCCSVVRSHEAPEAIGPYSQAIKANGFLFVSGQLGLKPGSTTLPKTVEEQALQCLQNLQQVLKAGGCTCGDVVKTTVLLSEASHFAAVNKIYKRFFEQQLQQGRKGHNDRQEKEVEIGQHNAAAEGNEEGERNPAAAAWSSAASSPDGASAAAAAAAGSVAAAAASAWFPARSCFTVKELPKGALVEIEAIAVVCDKKQE